MSVRWAFAGTPLFSERVLSALLEKGYRPEAVFTQPDRPSGRGMKLTASPVKQRAIEAGIPVFQPVRLKEDREIEAWMQAAQLDVWIVVAYGLLIPPALLSLPRWGCWNIHASLLPRWRGAAPIHRAIQMGDAETGVGIMQMEAGLDTGPVYVERRTPILPTDTTPVLHDRLVDLGIEALLETLQYAEQGCLPAPRPQSVEGVCYAEKIHPDEARLNWARNAEQLARQIRAFYPAPGAWTMFGEKRFKVGAAHVIQAPSSASDVTVGQLFSYKDESRVFPAVLCGEGSALCLERLQPAGSAYVEADKWWGHQAEGICFE